MFSIYILELVYVRLGVDQIRFCLVLGLLEYD